MRQSAKVEGDGKRRLSTESSVMDSPARSGNIGRSTQSFEKTGFLQGAGGGSVVSGESIRVGVTGATSMLEASFDKSTSMDETLKWLVCNMVL